MSIDQNAIYRTSNCADGMNPLCYFDRTEISARLNQMFNAYMEVEANVTEMKRNHWLVACIADHFQGIERCDELLPDENAV